MGTTAGADVPWPEPVDLDDLLPPQSSSKARLGLSRMRAALQALDNPQRSFAAIQVAGTNGKGSICSLVHGALTANGLRCGLYTSPHLVSWCERIRVGSSFVSSDVLRELLTELQPLSRMFALSTFEKLTVAAFVHFQREAVELAVLEVGLGGRLDATTAHGHRPIVAFAAIGYDHQEHLGTDLAGIAREKAAVLNRGCLALSGPQAPVVARVLEAEATRCGATLQWVAPLAQADFVALQLGLGGAVQRENAATALAVLAAVNATGYPLDSEASRRGMAGAQWPGRLETCRWRGHDVLVDGAHNVSAARRLREEISQRQGHVVQRQRTCWVLGIQTHKDAGALVAALLHPEDRAWIVAIDGAHCWSCRDVTRVLPEALVPLVQRPDSGDTWEPTAALDAVFGSHQDGKATVVIAGSLHLLGILFSRGVIVPVPFAHHQPWPSTPTP